MEKLDRLGWTVGRAVASQGVRVGIRANRVDALERVAEQLPEGWKPARSRIVDMMYSISSHQNLPNSRVQRFNLLFGGAQRLARTMDFEELLAAFNHDLHVPVAATARKRMFFQAGVVGWKGQAILAPGADSSGKTRLVRALVEAGATYYSNEFAVLDPEGQVHPYAVSMEIESDDAGRPKIVPVRTMGWPVGKKPLPIGVIVLSQYKQGAVFNPARATPGEAVLTFLANCFSPLREPDATLSLLAGVASGATVLKGVRGEAREAVDAILSRI